MGKYRITIRGRLSERFASAFDGFALEAGRRGETVLVGEVVVQETWLGVLRGLERFRGESSVKTWLFRILTNQAKTRAVREARSVPFSALGDESKGAVDESRFLPD